MSEVEIRTELRVAVALERLAAPAGSVGLLLTFWIEMVPEAERPLQRVVAVYRERRAVRKEPVLTWPLVLVEAAVMPPGADPLQERRLVEQRKQAAAMAPEAGLPTSKAAVKQE